MTPAEIATIMAELSHSGARDPTKRHESLLSAGKPFTLLAQLAFPRPLCKSEHPMTLRVAIVGCGKCAENHAAEIKKLACAQLVAVCDREPLMAEQFSIRHGVKAWYSDLSRLLSEQTPDVVHVTTPPQSHLDVALQAIAAGCHLFVEKPLAEDARQAAELIRVAQANGCKLTVGWTHYFDPAVRDARARIAQGVIGELVHVEASTAYDLWGNFGVSVLQDRTHWVHRLPGKLFQNNLDHPLAFLSEFVEPENCTLVAHAWRGTDSPYPDLLDELRVTMTGANTSAHLLFSCRARPAGHSLTLVGSKSTLRVDLINQLVTQDSVSRLPGPIGRLACALDHTRQLGWQTLHNLVRFVRSDFQPLPGLGFLTAEFYKCIESGGEVPISYAHMLRVSTLMDRVVQQLQEIPVMTL
jgi:predicted dehydrogenase